MKKNGRKIKIDVEATDDIGQSGDLDKTLTEEGINPSESEDSYVNNGRRNTTSVAK